MAKVLPFRNAKKRVDSFTVHDARKLVRRLAQDSKNVVIRLDQLEKAFKAGLITKHEYEEKRQVIMNQF